MMEDTFYFIAFLLVVVVLLALIALKQHEVRIGSVKLGKFSLENVRFKPRVDKTDKN